MYRDIHTTTLYYDVFNYFPNETALRSRRVESLEKFVFALVLLHTYSYLNSRCATGIHEHAIVLRP